MGLRNAPRYVTEVSTICCKLRACDPSGLRANPETITPRQDPPPEQPLPNLNPHPGGSAREGICPDTDVNYVYTSVSRTSV